MLRAVPPFGEEGASIVGISAGGLELARGEAVLRLLRHLAVETPLVVGLEDLQWVDADTLSILEYLADNLRDERVLCIATVRSQPRSAAYERLWALKSRRSAAVLALGPLAHSEVVEMVRACWPGVPAAEIDRVLAAADGVPFLVEELLATPGIPETFAVSVAVRLATLEDMERRVVEVAAVLGRHFEWELLADATGTRPEVIASALKHAVRELLLTHKGGAYRFRHALTREAVLDQVLPHVRFDLARQALAAVEAAHPGFPGVWRGVAADLAQQTGALDTAAQLVIDAGRESLRAGALATAVVSLTRASTLAVEPVLRRAAQELLVQALALSGRADECMAVGAQLLASPSLSPSARSAVHLWLAWAAVEATWWSEAGRHLTAAEHLLALDSDPALTMRHGVLAGETALAVGQLDEARRLANGVIGSGDANPDVRCHALVVLGRAERVYSLDRAKAAFEDARACADAYGLPLWRLRALHELGTIDLFDHAGSRRLEEAREAAEDLGAVSMVAVLDVQLSAACLFRFEPDAAIRHALSALAAADRLRLAQLRATAVTFLAENQPASTPPRRSSRSLRNGCPPHHSASATSKTGCRSRPAPSTWSPRSTPSSSSTIP